MQRHKPQPIAALPGFGTLRHGNVWFLVEMESGATLGPPHNSKLEALAYGYTRHEAYFGADNKAEG